MAEQDEGRNEREPTLKVNMPTDSTRHIRHAYDCQSIALINWSSKTYKVISSPNMNWIPDFPVLDDRGIFQRADGYWGPQEYSIWPQIYCHAFVHHMFIPIEIPDPPMHDILRKGSIVWRTVTPSDWQESGPSPFELFIEPIGKLSPDMSNDLSRALELTIATCVGAKDDLESSQKELMLHITNQARLAVEQLKREPRAERDVIQRVREVQRSIRELFGLYFYSRHVVEKRKTLSESTVSHPLGFRGVFVDDGVLAEEIRRARVPVWFIRPYESVLHDTRIYKVVSPTSWDRAVERQPWRSQVDGRDLFMAMSPSGLRPLTLRSGRNSLLTEAGMATLISLMRHAMGRDQGLNREPLEIGTSLNKRSREIVDSPASPPRMTDDETDTAMKPRQKKRIRGRPTKERGSASVSTLPAQQPLSFSILLTWPSHLPDLPDIPLLWRNALERVSPLPVYRESPARYHFPPPHLFGFQSTEKTYEHLHNWVRIKAYCERAALKQTVYLNDPGGLKIQDWRIVLLGDYTKGFLPLDKATTTPALERMKDTLPYRNDLIPKIDPTTIGKSCSKTARNAQQQSIKVIFAVEGNFTPYSRECEANWGGRTITFEDICSDAVLRSRILWDVCECQFRMDLIDADQLFTGMEQTGDSMAAGLRTYGAQRVWRDVDGSSRLFPDVSTVPCNIWSGSVKQTMLTDLINVLRFWPNAPEWMDTLRNEILSEDQCVSSLQDCIHFYVDSFVDVFHRLPCPPYNTPP